MAVCNKLEIKEGIEIDKPVNQCVLLSEKLKIFYEVTQLKIVKHGVKEGSVKFCGLGNFPFCQAVFMVVQNFNNLDIGIHMSKQCAV